MLKQLIKRKAVAHSTPADTTEAVDAFMKSLDHPAKREIQALRAGILAVDPSIREGVKWNAPSFRTTEYFATMHLRAKQGIMVVLHFGAKARSVAPGPGAIADPGKILTWVAKNRATVEFKSKDDLAAKISAFQKVLKQWIVHV